MEPIVEFNSKALKALENINQTAKHIFDRYFIIEDKILSLNSEDCVIRHGRHYITIREGEYFLDNYHYKMSPILLSSNVIFECFKNLKRKSIKYLLRHGDKVFIGDEDTNFLCGIIISMEEVYREFHKNDFIENTFTLKPFEVGIKIADSVFNKLVDGDPLLIKLGKYSVRTAKPAFPNLKKSDIVEVCFRETDDDDLFEGMFNIIKENGLTTHHIYTLLNYN